MAFYKEAPQKHTPRTNYANKGSWDEEGTHYSDRKGRSFEDSDRPEGKRSFSKPSGPRTGRPMDKKSGNFRNGAGEHHYNGPRTEDDKKPYNFRNDKRTDRARQERTDRPARFDRAPRGDYEDRREDFSADNSYRAHEYRAPHTEQKEEDLGANILCGRNPIREALKSDRDIEKLLVQKGELSGSAKEIVQLAKEKKIPVQEVEKNRMDEIAEHHQGLIAYASAYQYSTVEDMLADAKAKNEAPFLLILDGITDPHNLGAIIRTADCVGAHGVIVPMRRSVGLTPAAVKASAGAVEHVKVARVTNVTRTIDDLKAQNVWTYAVTMNGKHYEKVDFSGGVALVIGAEGEGISRLTEEHCDCAVSLPMKGHLDSLNASVAAGIMMYRVFSCRCK